MSRRAEKKLDTRKRLVDAALRLSAANGFAAVSLREVAREGGIAPASFYRHFHDMDELGLALLDQVGESIRTLLRQARKNRTPERSVVRTSIETFMEYVEKEGNLFRVFLGERSGSSSEFRVALRREMNRFVDELIEDLRTESERKDRPLAEIPLLAEAMVATVFHLGADALDMSIRERQDLSERLIVQLRLMLLGAEAAAAGWHPDLAGDAPG